MKLEKFKAVNTVLGNLKVSITGAYHSIKFAKYTHRYLAESQYKFNRCAPPWPQIRQLQRRSGTA